MSLKFDKIKIDKKEFHKSKQPIDLNLVDTNIDTKIVISDWFKYSDMISNILLATKKMISLNLYVLFYLKWVDT